MSVEFDLNIDLYNELSQVIFIPFEDNIPSLASILNILFPIFISYFVYVFSGLIIGY